ncbi:MAG: hypothetical protein USCGTAYLOR_00694 [Chromatiales bacterium USCg_Taylor]|nr:MAG: hypothetical protein USCGTAYLOR_00694 [Chromatiales bacterium USCg_Taylor]
MQGSIENALDGVITMDTSGRITGWNAQAETIFGWPREDACGRDHWLRLSFRLNFVQHTTRASNTSWPQVQVLC